MPKVEPILTTEEIRENYIDSDTILEAHAKQQYAEFDRWLAQHDNEIRADSLVRVAGALDAGPALPRVAAWMRERASVLKQASQGASNPDANA